jgi:hypothetical protein
MLVYLVAHAMKPGEVMLLVVPLKMLTKQFIDKLRALNIPAVRLRDIEGTPVVHSVRVVLVAMEEITVARERMLRTAPFWQAKVRFIVFDEVHLFPLWSKHGFRPKLSEAFEFRQLFKEGVTVATLSGSPSPPLRASIARVLHLRHSAAEPTRPPETHNECLKLRVNISVLKAKDGGARDLDLALTKLGIPFRDDSKIIAPGSIDQLIVFVKDRNLAMYLALDWPPFKHLNARFEQCVLPLHGGNTEAMQQLLADNLQTGKTRIAVVTQVLQAGFHSDNVRDVVILGAMALGHKEGHMQGLCQMSARGGCRGHDHKHPLPIDGYRCLLCLSAKTSQLQSVQKDTDFLRFLESVGNGGCSNRAMAEFLQCCALPPSNSSPHHPIAGPCCPACSEQLAEHLGRDNLYRAPSTVKSRAKKVRHSSALVLALVAFTVLLSLTHGCVHTFN